MKLKTKLISAVMLLVSLSSMTIVGVFAVIKTNFKVGGSINFTATGINAEISQGTLSSTGLWVDESDAQIKLQKVILNTSKTPADIAEDFQSWQDLNMMFGDSGEDVAITFTITNTSTREECFEVNSSVNTAASENMTATISPVYAALVPDEVQEYTLTFSITDPSKDASLSGFEIDLNMNLVEVKDESEYPTLEFSRISTTNQCSVAKNSSNLPTGEVEIPPLVKISDVVYKVKHLAVSAFLNCTELTKISIPLSISSFGPGAFQDCSNLEGEIIIPEGSTKVARSTFSSCSKITSIKIPSTVVTIENHAFYGCSSWADELVFPSGLTTIGNSSFAGCSKLKGELVFPESVQTIDKYAFAGCRGFTGELRIPEGITSISEAAFMNCSGVTSVTIPSSVKTIYKYGIYNLKNVQTLVLPEGLTTLVDEACSYGGYTKVYIPSTLSTVGTYSFNVLTELTTVIINSATIAGALSDGAACGYILKYSPAIYINTDIKDSLNSYIIENYTNVTVYTEGEYAGYTCYSE